MKTSLDFIDPESVIYAGAGTFKLLIKMIVSISNDDSGLFIIRYLRAFLNHPAVYVVYGTLIVIFIASLTTTVTLSLKQEKRKKDENLLLQISFIFLILSIFPIIFLTIFLFKEMLFL